MAFLSASDEMPSRKVSVVRASVKGALTAFGMLGMLRRVAGRTTDRIVIMFHGVDGDGSVRFNRRFVGADQLKTLLLEFRRGWDVVPLETIFSERRTRIRRPLLAVTFDDGQKNNLSHALPVLEECRVPATFFVTALRTMDKAILWFDAVDIYSTLHDGPFTFGRHVFRKRHDGQLANDAGDLNAFVMGLQHVEKYLVIDKLKSEARARLEELPELDPYWKLLDESDIRALSRSPYVEIGSHATSHTNLTLLTDAAVHAELQESKAYLESTTGLPCRSLAFPNGSYDDRIVRMAHDAGYTRQLAVTYARPEDARDMRLHWRLGLYPDRPVEALTALVREACPP